MRGHGALRVAGQELRRLAPVKTCQWINAGCVRMRYRLQLNRWLNGDRRRVSQHTGAAGTEGINHSVPAVSVAERQLPRQVDDRAAIAGTNCWRARRAITAPMRDQPVRHHQRQRNAKDEPSLTALCGAAVENVLRDLILAFKFQDRTELAVHCNLANAAP